MTVLSVGRERRDSTLEQLLTSPGPARQGEEGMRLSGGREWGKQPELRTWN